MESRNANPKAAAGGGSNRTQASTTAAGGHAPAKKPVGKMIVFGVISLALYMIVFNNEKMVMEVFTKGGAYAAGPLLTALIFSFIHGAFASNFLSVLGIEAKKKH